LGFASLLDQELGDRARLGLRLRDRRVEAASSVAPPQQDLPELA
jgi:hypothetical protein